MAGHRRCELCDGYPEGDHCWTDDVGVGYGKDTHDCACRHCPAVGMECGGCDGIGVAWDDDDGEAGAINCPECDGQGVIEDVSPRTLEDAP